MRSRITPFEPFEFYWEGCLMQAKIDKVEMEQSFDEPTRLRLGCVVEPLDNEETTHYNKNKGVTMNCWDTFPTSITFSKPDIYRSEWVTTLNNKEDDMSLTKKYANRKRDKKEQLAIDNRLLNEDGTLTYEGKDLLLQMLLEKHREEFLQTVEELSSKEDEE